MRSLRARLLVWVLLPLACTVAVAAWLSYQRAAETAMVVQDRLLLGSARSIAEQIRFEDGSFVHQIPPAALELFQSTQPDHIYYRVTTSAGRLLAGYSELQRPATSIFTREPYFFNSVMRASPVRVVALFQPVAGAPNAGPVMVQVAQTLVGRQQMVADLWMHAVVEQLLLLLLAGALILFGLHRGLQPLLQLRDAVNARVPGTLTPMSTEAMPMELVPLVASLNDYIRRLEAHAGAQSIFIQNAAHQLRTPFALLNTQLSYAVRASTEADRTESVGAAYRTLQQAIRLINQLLTLSMAESLGADASTDADADIDMVQLIQEVFESLVAQAQGKAINLGFDMPTAVPTLCVNPWLVKEIFLNLVDNAIRYTPRGGSVTVRLEVVAGQTTVVVEDNGVGIAPRYRDKVFERFYRIHNTDSNGSGLGLAIVRQLADRIGAQVQLTDASGGAGLAVRVTFATLPSRPKNAAMLLL
ncbi:sensor histidine kinase [Rhodoferax sp.]|uniref:sensor histidine kinase n=1 Tax=Rhodoferax sp. TaxID=50421 RepID=UPI0028519475|nr:sensor histidine kinase [Rhodoferax sp.]MDR3367854.1 sensor histidine kinase [Rhodoferax sp.]